MVVLMIGDDVNSVPILDLANNSIPFEFVDCSDDVDSVPSIDLADNSISLEFVDFSDGDVHMFYHLGPLHIHVVAVPIPNVTNLLHQRYKGPSPTSTSPTTLLYIPTMFCMMMMK